MVWSVAPTFYTSLLKEILFVNVCKMFVFPPKYLLHYDFLRMEGPITAFTVNLVKVHVFICPKRGLGFYILNPYSWVSLNLCLGLGGVCWGLNDIMLIKCQPGTFWMLCRDMLRFLALLTCLSAWTITTAVASLPDSAPMVMIAA